jgi:PadR family transcriptional regulator, regulatory protein PadR
MPPQKSEIPSGTLDMLILRTLSRTEPLHGFEIADSIEQASGEVFHIEEGSLYPALQRMLLKGWLHAEWGRTDENRRARYYRLTAAGRKQLERELAQYSVTSTAIARVLSPA